MPIIARDAEPPPGSARRGLLPFDAAAELPIAMDELEPFDHIIVLVGYLSR
jgi:hypothetical protein